MSSLNHIEITQIMRELGIYLPPNISYNEINTLGTKNLTRLVSKVRGYEKRLRRNLNFILKLNDILHYHDNLEYDRMWDNLKDPQTTCFGYYPGFQDRKLKISEYTEYTWKYKKEIKRQKENLDNLKRLLRILQNLIPHPIDKPLLPALRKIDHFQVGDSVAIYLSSLRSDYLDDKWVGASTVDTRSNLHGALKFITDFALYELDKFKGMSQLSGSLHSHEILLDSEFEYMLKAQKKDQQFLRLWIKSIYFRPNDFSETQYFKSFSKENKIKDSLF